jgi:hypothetical protein
MFLSHLDPDPDRPVRGIDPDPAPGPDQEPSITMQKKVRKSWIRSA